MVAREKCPSTPTVYAAVELSSKQAGAQSKPPHFAQHRPLGVGSPFLPHRERPVHQRTRVPRIGHGPPGATQVRTTANAPSLGRLRAGAALARILPTDQSSLATATPPPGVSNARCASLRHRTENPQT